MEYDGLAEQDFFNMSDEKRTFVQKALDSDEAHVRWDNADEKVRHCVVIPDADLGTIRRWERSLTFSNTM